MKLSPRQKLFVEAYCTHFSPSKAYVEAGFNNSAHKSTRAYELLQKPQVATAIEARLANKKKTFRIREDEILEGLYKEATNESARPSERIQAWVQIGKHLGMFREKEQQKEGNVTYNVINYNSHSPMIEKKTEEAIKVLTNQQIIEAKEIK